MMTRRISCLSVIFGLLWLSLTLATPVLAQQPDDTPPDSPVKLIFIHHSTGGNWLADIGQNDQAGGLGQMLMANNYYVSATNYGWGPDAIGDSTDIPDWPRWFTDTVMSAVYAETGQNFGGFGDWTRLAADPGGENEIIMFKSCFPNSDLYGNPNDPPLTEPNGDYTVANAKAVYNHLLTYFAAHQDKLFVVITSPPQAEGEYGLNDPGIPAATRAANARAFTTWLRTQWLSDYPHHNVAVFDYYNVLTSNGSAGRVDDTSVTDEPNDYTGRPDGNHHYWNGSAETYAHTIDNNFSAYPSYSGGPDWFDSHPMGAGQQKAAAEFVPLLNYFYNRWQQNSGGETCRPLTDVTISGATSGAINAAQTFTAQPAPGNATTPITYTWRPDPDVGSGAVVSYTWALTATYAITVSAQNCGAIVTDGHTIAVSAPRTYWVYLPLILKAWPPTPPPTPTPNQTPQPGPTLTPTPTSIPPNAKLILPADLTYAGAFRLPDPGERPLTFEYGGNAMSFNPDGDPAGSDGYPGSLFISGHDRLPYGELSDGSRIAEINIPAPAIESDVADLPQASIIQPLQDVLAGHFTAMNEIPKMGMQYLNHTDTGPLLHIAWGQHLQPENTPSHAWASASLGVGAVQGEWFIGDQNLYSTNGYMFDIPPAWADTNANGRYLATGRMRDGGQGGMGPTLFAYKPWLAAGTAPVSGTHLAETTLLLYENTYNSEEIVRAMNGYQHPDEWEGGAWMTTPSGDTALVFAGTKGNGSKYWYGYRHPDGPNLVCVDAEVTDFTTCRLRDGTPCPATDFGGCCDEGAETCISMRGWWTTHFDAQLIFYNPDDLAQVAAGSMEPWQPQPYAVMDIDERLYFNPPVWDVQMLGQGDQRRYRIGAAAYDHATATLYVLEQFAEQAKPVVHVWRIN